MNSWTANLPLWLLFAPALVYACWSDYQRLRVPNWLNAALAAGGLIWQTSARGTDGLIDGLLGFAAGFGLLVGLWMVRAMGAGDVKFLAAIGCWLGPRPTLHAAVAAGLLGGLIALFLIGRRKAWAASACNVHWMMSHATLRTTPPESGSGSMAQTAGGMVPYAIPIALGAAWVLLATQMGWWGR